MAQDLDAFSVFQRAVSLKSMTAAAKALGLRKDSISLRFKNLEKFLGVALLMRTTRKMSLTEAGQQFLSLYAPLWAALLAARRIVRGQDPLPPKPPAITQDPGKIEITLRWVEGGQWVAVCQPSDRVVLAASLPEVLQKVAATLVQDLSHPPSTSPKT